MENSTGKVLQDQNVTGEILKTEKPIPSEMSASIDLVLKISGKPLGNESKMSPITCNRMTTNYTDDDRALEELELH